MNPDHSKGKNKNYLLTLHGGFRPDVESMNRFYDWLAFRVLDYNNNLYKVIRFPYGIKLVYLSAFRSQVKPSDLVYVLHVWQTSYFLPENKDLTVLSSDNLSITKPVLEGRSRLNTCFARTKDDLNQEQLDFAKRKHWPKKGDLQIMTRDFQEQKGSWLIKDQETLLKNRTDWRKCFPVLET